MQKLPQPWSRNITTTVEQKAELSQNGDGNKKHYEKAVTMMMMIMMMMMMLMMDDDDDVFLFFLFGELTSVPIGGRVWPKAAD